MGETNELLGETMVVYKYLPPERTDVLRGGRIRFTQASALNDPFESTPLTAVLRESLIQGQEELLASTGNQLYGHDSTVRYHMRKNARKSVENIINDTRNNKGILSLSLNRSELLMWSHYCNSHRGFIIGFDGLHEYFQKGIPDKRGGLRPVIYSEHRPSLPPFSEFSNYNVAEILLFTKSPHWGYERELRMLHNVKDADDDNHLDPNGNKVYLFNFPAESVKEVILGCQMPVSLIKEITNLIKERYQDAEVYQAVMSKTEFNLEFSEV